MSSHATFPLESKQNCKGKRKNLQEDFQGGISPPTEPKGGSDDPLQGRPPPPGLSGRGKPGSWRFWWIPSYHLQLQLFHHAFSQAKAKNKSKEERGKHAQTRVDKRRAKEAAQKKKEEDLRAELDSLRSQLSTQQRQIESLLSEYPGGTGPSMWWGVRCW